MASAHKSLYNSLYHFSKGIVAVWDASSLQFFPTCSSLKMVC